MLPILFRALGLLLLNADRRNERLDAMPRWRKNSRVFPVALLGIALSQIGKHFYSIKTSQVGFTFSVHKHTWPSGISHQLLCVVGGGLRRGFPPLFPPSWEAVSRRNDVMMCYWICELWSVWRPTGTVTAPLSPPIITIGRLCTRQRLYLRFLFLYPRAAEEAGRLSDLIDKGGYVCLHKSVVVLKRNLITLFGSVFFFFSILDTSAPRVLDMSSSYLLRLLCAWNREDRCVRYCVSWNLWCIKSLVVQVRNFKKDVHCDTVLKIASVTSQASVDSLIHSASTSCPLRSPVSSLLCKPEWKCTGFVRLVS